MKNDKTYDVLDENQLLKFLLENLKDKSRNNIKSLLKNSKVRVNGKIAKQFDLVLKKGDIVKIDSSIINNRTVNLPFTIIYEDDNLIVIDKPSGLLSIATDKEKERTAYHYLMDYVKNANASNRLFIVHRLDKNTSGVLIFSKNEKFRDLLQKNWNNLVKKRTYIALIEGKLKDKKGKIETDLKENKMGIVYSTKDNDGKKAITNYEVVKENDNYSLLNIDIDTGRKNQIRVHFSELGHPVVGDKKYGSKIDPIKRLCLHSSEIKIINPLTKEELTFVSKKPNKFLSIIK